MKSVQFNFKGMMAPVFNAFTDDKKRTVNCDVIDKYAQFLKQKGVTAVLVNGTTGEGTTMKLEERMRTTEEWWKVCQKYEMICMVQIGGASIADVYELAVHAERLGVHSVLCLPDLFFKPMVEEDLVCYLKDVAERCPSRPFFYYHIPTFTNVRVSMPRFCTLAEQEIPNFCGLKFTSTDLDEGAACLKADRIVFLGADTILTGALALGFDSAIMTTLNIFPEWSFKIFEFMRNNNVQDALAAQVKMNKRIFEICPRGDDWVDTMKMEFNKVNTTFKTGPCRKPIMNSIKKQY